MFSTFILFQTDRTLVCSRIRLHVSTLIIVAIVEHGGRIEYNGNGTLELNILLRYCRAWPD